MFFPPFNLEYVPYDFGLIFFLHEIFTKIVTENIMQKKIWESKNFNLDGTIWESKNIKLNGTITKDLKP